MRTAGLRAPVSERREARLACAHQKLAELRCVGGYSWGSGGARELWTAVLALRDFLFISLSGVFGSGAVVRGVHAVAVLGSDGQHGCVSEWQSCAWSETCELQRLSSWCGIDGDTLRHWYEQLLM